MPLLQRAPQNSQGPRIQWGTDVQVRAGYSRGISSDCFTTPPFHAYALAIGAGDTLFVYRTLNSGTSWGFWAYLPNAQGIKQAKVVCSPGDTNWVALFILFNNSGAGNLTAYYVDENFNQRQGTVATGSADSTLEQFDAALQTNVLNPYYYVTYGRRRNPVSPDSLGIYFVRSLDNGATWTDRSYRYGPTWVSPAPKITGGAGPYAYTTIRDRYQTGDSVQIHRFRSTDFGVTWSVSQQVSNYAYNALANYGVAAGPGDSSAFVLHGFYSTTYLNQLIIQHSTDNGLTWTNHRAVRSTTNNEELGSIVGLRGGYGGSGYVNLLSLSFNVGTPTADTTWSGTIYSTYPDSFMQLLAIGDHVASTSQGPAAGWIVRGSNWNPWTAYCGFGPTDVWADYDGLSGVEVEAPVARKVNGISLSQNIPNPFGKGTRIAFSLPKSGSVDMAVYDIAGRKVATLAQGTMSAGSHEVSWNGAKAPAGVYFYRLSFEGKTLTNRMVVVK
jgi:hypothetical protein